MAASNFEYMALASANLEDVEWAQMAWPHRMQ